VSYGEQATWFLVTMRASRESPATDVRLVLLNRADGSVRVDGDWSALGMRGTRSVPMSFDVTVDPGAIIGGSFREIALRTMIPAAHVGWAAAWLGAARLDDKGVIEYGMGFDEQAEGDTHAISNGVTILVAAGSVELLTGATLDYVEINPGEWRFIFVNPNDPSHKAPKPAR
jgi:hypothetical protein